MPRQSRRPERTCIGCMRRDSKRAMVRIVTRDGEVHADFTAHLPGRGAYLHPRAECLDRFVKSKVKVFRSLRRRIEQHERLATVKLIKARLDSGAAVE